MLGRLSDDGDFRVVGTTPILGRVGDYVRRFWVGGGLRRFWDGWGTTAIWKKVGDYSDFDEGGGTTEILVGRRF